MPRCTIRLAHAALGVTLAIAFIDPIGALVAEAVPTFLLWRVRWMFPAAANVGLFVVCAYLIARRLSESGLRRREAAAVAAGVAVALGALALSLAGGQGRILARDGAVVRASKLARSTHELAAAMGGVDAAPFLLAPPFPEGELSAQICQIVPRVRLVVSRPLVVEWFYGINEEERRSALLASFYDGTMSPAKFHALRLEFPVDWAVVDLESPYRERQRELLASLAWQRIAVSGRWELWRIEPGSR